MDSNTKKRTFCEEESKSDTDRPQKIIKIELSENEPQSFYSTLRSLQVDFM